MVGARGGELIAGKFKWPLGVLLVLVAIAAADAGMVLLTNNFHTVVAGSVYRSAQPSRTDLEKYHQQLGIRSVVNLRGINANARWYRDEVNTTKSLGIELINFAMSAKHRMSQARARELIQVLARAPKPMLIHCNGGADRTGLAASLYLAGVAKIPEEEAEGQLSILYGHFALISSASAMDDSFEDIEVDFGGSEDLWDRVRAFFSVRDR